MALDHSRCGVSRTLRSTKLVAPLILLMSLLEIQMAHVSSMDSFGLPDLVSDVRLIADGALSQASWRLQNPTGAVQYYRVDILNREWVGGNCLVAHSTDGNMNLTQDNCDALRELQSSVPYLIQVMPYDSDFNPVGIHGFAFSRIPTTDVMNNLVLDAGVDSIDASWRLDEPSGAAMEYRVACWGLDGLTRYCAIPATNSSHISTSDCSEDRTELSPCSPYVIWVVQQTSDGMVTAGMIGMIYTLPTGPLGNINLACEFSEDSTSSQNLTAFWESPGQCLEYSVDWVGHSQSADNEMSISGSQTTRLGTVQIAGVLPNTRYTVTVGWQDEGGKKSESCEATVPSV